MIHVYSAGQTCIGQFSLDMIEHSDTILPEDVGETSDLFTVACKEGYSPTVSSGSLICDEHNQWKNKPKCLGKTLLFILTKLHV